jgi:hypothetical protein
VESRIITVRTAKLQYTMKLNSRPAHHPHQHLISVIVCRPIEYEFLEGRVGA